MAAIGQPTQRDADSRKRSSWTRTRNASSRRVRAAQGTTRTRGNTGEVERGRFSFNHWRMIVEPGADEKLDTGARVAGASRKKQNTNTAYLQHCFVWHVAGKLNTMFRYGPPVCLNLNNGFVL